MYVVGCMGCRRNGLGPAHVPKEQATKQYKCQPVQSEKGLIILKKTDGCCLYQLLLLLLIPSIFSNSQPILLIPNLIIPFCYFVSKYLC